LKPGILKGLVTICCIGCFIFSLTCASAQQPATAEATGDNYCIGTSMLLLRQQSIHSNPAAYMMPVSNFGGCLSMTYYIYLAKSAGFNFGIRLSVTTQAYKFYSQAGIETDQFNGAKGQNFGTFNWEFPMMIEKRIEIGRRLIWVNQVGICLRTYTDFGYESIITDSLDFLWTYYSDYRDKGSIHSFAAINSGLMLRLGKTNFIRFGIGFQYNFLNTNVYGGEYVFYDGGVEFSNGKYFSNGDQVSVGLEYVIGGFRNRAERQKKYD